MYDKSAVIFMTTYNGSQYLLPQLDSIVSQTFDNWHLYISDDGSSDETLNILEKYESDDSRITVRVNQDEHGAYANYYSLFEFYKEHHDCAADYYFFCDQDDIWVLDKLEIEITELCKLEKLYGDNCPMLCYSDLDLISSDGSALNKRMSDITNIDLTENPLNIFFAQIYVWGTTAAINRSLWNVVSFPEHNRNDLSHDNWFAKHAILLNGYVWFIPTPLVRYRRHDENVSQLPKKYGLLSAIVKGITSFPGVVDGHAHVYWSSLQVLNAIKTLDMRGKQLQRVFKHGGLYAVRYMKENAICPGGNKYNQIARYIDLGLRLYRLTDWFRAGFKSDALLIERNYIQMRKS